MPFVQTSRNVKLHYQVDDFSDPWTSPETVLFVHGVAERGDAWRAWVPHFARNHRVIRIDWRGFGEAPPLVADDEWTFDTPVDDLAELCKLLELPPVHLISAKLGGTVAMAFAARYPSLLRTLSVVSSPVSIEQSLGEELARWIEMVRTLGVHEWAKRTMAPRLGSAMSSEGATWWAEMMGRTDATTLLKVFEALPGLDVTPLLRDIQCPALVMTTTGSKLGTVQAVEQWQRLIPGSRLEVVASDSYHIAASDPDGCARSVLQFIRS